MSQPTFLHNIKYILFIDKNIVIIKYTALFFQPIYILFCHLD